MDHYKISELLNDSFVSKSVTKGIDLNGLLSGRCSARNNVMFKTSMLRSDLCDYSDSYIVVKGRSVRDNTDVKKRNKKLTFTNNSPFRSCTTKIN